MQTASYLRRTSTTLCIKIHINLILRWNQRFPKSMEPIASIFLFQVLSEVLPG